MMLTCEMVCKERRRKKKGAAAKIQHVPFFPSPGFPHCSLWLGSPLGPLERLSTPQTKVEKKYHGTKALYVMLSSCIDFSLLFFCVYLTDNMKSLLCVMPKRALEITLASPSPLTSWVKMFLGRGSVRRP